MAQDTDKVKYTECAEVLKESILKHMPGSTVEIVTTRGLPHGDFAPESDWKLINDWQVYDSSPFEYTIKLEADMIINSNIDYWWDVLKERDVVVCSTIRDYRGYISNNHYYRQFIIDNKLPNVYNGITYFKKSEFSELFFKTVKNIFLNWEEYKKILKCNSDEIATTDWVYSLACHILGEENTTMKFEQMSFVHMKQMINNLLVEDWTKELVYELTDPIKIQTFPQFYPLHYHVKEFSKELRKNG